MAAFYCFFFVTAIEAVKLGAIFDFSGANGAELLRALQVAETEVNTNFAFPDGGLSILVNDSSSNIAQILSYFTANNVSGIIGAGGLPVLASIASASVPFLSLSPDACTYINSTSHPRYLSLLPACTAQTTVFVELAAQHGWQTVQVLYSANAYGTHLADEFQRLATSRGLDTSQTSITINATGQAVGIGAALTSLSAVTDYPVATVVFLSASNQEQFLSQIVQAGLDDENHIWLFSETTSTASISTPSLRKGGVGIWSTAGRWKKDATLYEDIGQTPQFLSRLAYDGVMTYAQAFSSMFQLNLNISNPSSVLSALLNVNFIGASGYIEFSPFLSPLLASPSVPRSRYRSSAFFRVVEFDAVSYQSIGLWSAARGLVVENAPSFEANVSQSMIDPQLLAPPFFDWNHVPHFGSPFAYRFGMCAVISQSTDVIYVFGGSNTPVSATFSDVWEYSLREEKWSQKVVLSQNPGPHNYFACALDDDTLVAYIFGGSTKRGSSDETWGFRLADSTWTQIPTGKSPSPRFDPGYVETPNGFYIMSGTTRSPDGDLWFFSYQTFQWTQKASPPRVKTDPSIYSPCVVSQTMNNQTILYTTAGGIIRSLSLYYTWNDTWADFPVSGTYPASLTDAMCQILGNYIWVAFGWNNVDEVDLQDVWKVDIRCPGATCAKWTHVGIWNSAEEGRDSMSSVTYGTDLIAIGGWSTSIHNDLATFSISDETDTMVSPDRPSPPARVGHAASSVTHQLFIFGGRSFSTTNDGSYSILSDLWAFDFLTKMWSQVAPDGLLPDGRYGHTLTSAGFQLVLFGGQTSDTEVLNDLHVYSVVRGSWKLIQPTGAIPKARTEHSSIALDQTNLLIYGGKDGTGLVLTDMWVHDLVYGVWTQWDIPTLPVDDGTQPSNMAMTKIGDSLFLFGGWDAAFVIYDAVYSFDLTYKNWTILTAFPGGARNHLAISHVGDNLIFLFGGSSYYDIFNDLWAFNVVDETWSAVLYGDEGSTSTFEVTQSPFIVQNSGPEVLAGATMVYHGNSLFVFGGYGAEYPGGGFGTGNLFTSETWEYALGPICEDYLSDTPYGTFQIPAEYNLSFSCFPCSAGTYFLNGSCILVPPGYFAAAAGADIDTLEACAPGFYNNRAGAASSTLCIPCSSGFYASDAGSAECLPCDDGQTCLIGATRPINMTSEDTQELITWSEQQPEEIKTNTEKATSIATNILISCLAVGCALALLGLIFFPRLMKNIDIMATDHDSVKNTPVFNRQTKWGGVFTLVGSFLAMALILSILVSFSIDNKYETTALVPIVGNNEAEMSATFTLEGAQDYTICTAADVSGWTTCAPLVNVTSATSATTGPTLNDTGSYMECQFIKSNSTLGGSTCALRWQCPRCSFLVASATLQVSFLQPGTFASSVAYTFSSASGYPNQRSTISGKLQAASAYLIRSLSKPTKILLRATPSTYEDVFQGLTLEGYKLSYADSSLGTQVSPLEFPEQNGVSVEVDIEKSDTSLEIVLRQRLGPLDLVSQILGTWAGLFGLVVTLLNKWEWLEPEIRKILRMKRSHDDVKFEDMLDAWKGVLAMHMKSKGRVFHEDSVLSQQRSATVASPSPLHSPSHPEHQLPRPGSVTDEEVELQRPPSDDSRPAAPSMAALHPLERVEEKDNRGESPGVDKIEEGHEEDEHLIAVEKHSQ